MGASIKIAAGRLGGAAGTAEIEADRYAAAVPNETRADGLDRRRDLLGWVLTPLVTLVLGPAVAAAVGILVLLQGDTRAPCEQSALDNRCEESTLSLLGAHGVLFGLLWLPLWPIPWWRGLRPARIALAVVACGVLVAVPLRMAGLAPAP
jgi:hypothetical protein